MTDSILHTQGDEYKPKLWLNSHGNLYTVPTERADLERALHFQRQLTTHLVNVIVYLAASKRGVR